jgi:hypothetical protein
MSTDILYDFLTMTDVASLAPSGLRLRFVRIRVATSRLCAEKTPEFFNPGVTV